MRYIIQNLHQYDTKIKDAAETLGLEVAFVDVGQVYNDIYNPNKDVILHGSINMIKHLSSVYGLKNFTPFDRLKCQNYYAYWGDKLFNTEYIFLPINEAIRRYYELKKKLDADYLFVRPDTNDKVFNGDIYDKEDLQRLINNETVTEETLVVIAPAFNIDREWRMFLHRGKVIAGSQYKLNGRLNVEEDLTPKSFAESIPQYSGLPPVYVLDIAEISGEFYVLEVGSVNCAGPYNANIAPIVQAIVQEMELQPV